MLHRVNRRISLLIALLMLCDAVVAQDAPRRPRRNRPAGDDAQVTPGSTAEDVPAFWWSSERIERELQRRGQTPPVWTVGDGRIAAVIDKAHIGMFYESSGPSRFVAWHLQVGNRTSEPLVLPREFIRAEIDGDWRATAEIKPQLVYHGFAYADEHYELRDCQPVKELRVPAGGVASTWLVYGNIGTGQTVPPSQLELTIAGQRRTVDVTAVQRALLGLEVERLGPKECLALITIGGRINTFNMQSLIDELDAAVAQKVTRAVVRWKPDAPTPDHQLAAWLHSSAAFAGTGRVVSEQLPIISASLREMHLVQLPQGAFPDTDAASGLPPKVHPTELDAVAAALRTAYFAVTADDIRQAIRTGAALSRAAALIHGSERLDTSDLPMLVAFTRDASPPIRQAALMALGGFGDPAAIEPLTQAARSDTPADAQAAIRALAESRFQSAREALVQLLETADPAVEQRIIAILAERPRGDWADVLFAHAQDPDGRIRTDVLKALVRLEHPQIVDLLERGLRGNDSGQRDLAFTMLSARSDARSDKLATDFVLKQIEDQPPTGPVLDFLNRTRDPKALPVLLRHLRTSSDKSSLINLLGQLGDSPTGDRLIAMFPKLEPHEQVAALNAVRSLRHPGFLALATEAIDSSDPTVANHAIQGLTQFATPDAQRVLCQAMDEATKSQTLQPLALALANFASPGARETLQRAAQSKDRPRRDAGRMGLQNLRLRSPGFQYIHQATSHLQEKQYDEALQLFQLAAELDPWLPEAQIGIGQIHLRHKRWADAGKSFQKAIDLDPSSAEVHAALGDAYLKQEQWSAAATAFRKAQELNPKSGLVVSGLAISQVMQGHLDAGLAIAEAGRAQFAKDAGFLYNTACVYGRAVEQTEKRPASPERD
ncbi:MAG TPA: HEAT repeat domain-containing protein, partial [Planctomycetaceae bacterium]|nr:HEAT repeat domain-containing protein [Planctomycetaceae bacterium]